MITARQKIMAMSDEQLKHLVTGHWREILEAFGAKTRLECNRALNMMADELAARAKNELDKQARACDSLLVEQSVQTLINKGIM